MAKLLADKRKQWKLARGENVVEGTRLTYSKAIEIKYRKQLESLAAPMVAEYMRVMRQELTRAVAAGYSEDGFTTDISRRLAALRDRWESKFAKRAQRIVSSMLAGVEKDAHVRLNSSLRELAGQMVHTPNMTEALAERMVAANKANVALIKSIPQKFHYAIEEVVFRSVQTGGKGAKSILREIEDIGVSTKKRAELIAVDQTRKATTAINEERMRSAGITQFRWVHSGGGREPRQLHVEYDGQIFDLDDPPIIDERTGERGFPGQLINCRCTQVPLLSF